MADGNVNAWPRVALGEVLRPVREMVELRAAETYRGAGIYSFGRGLFAKADFLGSETSYGRMYRLSEGQFVYSRLFAWEGAFAIVEPAFDGVHVSQEFPPFGVDLARVDPRWLRLVVCREGFWGALYGGGLGQRRRRVQPEELLDQAIPLPPLAEQQRIVARVADLCAKVDEAETLRASLVDVSTCLRDAVVESLLVRLETVRRRLGDLATVRAGIQKGPHREPGSNPVRYLTVAHVQRNRLLWGDPRFFEVWPEELDRWSLAPGDVLVIEGNGNPDEIGRAAVFQGEVSPCVHQNHVLRLRPDKETLIPEYLALYINSSRGRAAIQKLGRTSSGLVTLSTGRLSDIEIEVPGLRQQSAIVQAAANADAKIQVYATTAADQHRELTMLRAAIIERAVRGEL